MYGGRIHCRVFVSVQYPRGYERNCLTRKIQRKGMSDAMAQAFLSFVRLGIVKKISNCAAGKIFIYTAIKKLYNGMVLRIMEKLVLKVQ